MSKRKPRFSLIPFESYKETHMKLADIINQPHEDYPLRVRATAEALEMNGAININKMWFLSVHNYIMNDETHRGRYRSGQVQVGNHIPPASWLVPQLMDELIDDINNVLCDEDREYTKEEMYEFIKEWYYRFEMIHPFEDGNGRVGGVFVATLSWIYGDHYLVPDANGDILYSYDNDDEE